MHGSGVGVAIGSVQIEEVESAISRKGVRQALCHQGDQLSVGLSTEREAAFAFKCSKEMMVRRQRHLRLHGLEEIPPILRALQHSADAHLQPIPVTELGTGALPGEFGKEGRDGREETPMKG